MAKESSAEAADRELVVTRTFDAPRELVFEAFTDPKRLMQWWGPHGCTVVFCQVDLRPGGTWAISMRSPRVLPQFANRYPHNPEPGRIDSRERRDRSETALAGQDWIVEKQRGVYQEVVKPERLIFTYAFEDDGGRLSHQTRVTINFADEDGKTKLTLHQAVFDSVSARNDHVRGWTEALEDLSEFLINTN